MGRVREIGIFVNEANKMLNLNEVMSTLLLVISVFIVGYIIYHALKSDDKVEGQRLLVVVVLFFFHAVFWALFEQAGGSLTIFAKGFTNLNLFGFAMPISWMNLANPIFVVIFAPKSGRKKQF